MHIFLAEISQFPTSSLGPDETRHCSKVLRHQPGDEIYITEGKGFLYRAKIISFSKNETLLEIIQSFESYGEHSFHISLAVSPLRLKDRFEWMMEKAVELGVNEIVPLQCHRTDPYKAKFKEARINTILLTALKQCKRSRLPHLAEIRPFDSWIGEDHEGEKLMGWCETQEPVQHLEESIKKASKLTLLIGPEGDFTPEEVGMAKESGFVPVFLGENRLRTETAAIYGLSMLKFLKGY